jgi:hypothetical protein
LTINDFAQHGLFDTFSIMFGVVYAFAKKLIHPHPTEGIVSTHTALTAAHGTSLPTLIGLFVAALAGDFTPKLVDLLLHYSRISLAIAALVGIFAVLGTD